MLKGMSGNSGGSSHKGMEFQQAKAETNWEVNLIKILLLSSEEGLTEKVDFNIQYLPVVLSV